MPKRRVPVRSYRVNESSQLRLVSLFNHAGGEGNYHYGTTQAKLENKAATVRLRATGARRSARFIHSCFLLLSPIIFIAIGCERAPLTDSGVITVFGGVGLADGNFNYPRSIATDKQRNVFVVDKTGRIQRFDAEGQFEHSWRVPEIASGFPVGLAVNPDGRLFVADTHYHRVLVYDREGALLSSFGHEGNGDGEFQLPTDVAFDAKGFIYVSEYHENDRVTKWSPDLQFVRALSPSQIEGLPLSRPTGLVVDDEQTLWIADACNHRIVRMSLDGQVLKVFGSFGSAPGEMRYPYDISLSPEGTLMVCEYEGNRLQWFTKDGRSLRIWGKPGRALGELFAPWGAVYGPHGRVYVVDSLNARVQVIEP